MPLLCQRFCAVKHNLSKGQDMLNFLLRRGQFHAGIAARVRASRSISCHDRTGRELFKVDRGINVAVVVYPTYGASPVTSGQR